MADNFADLKAEVHARGYDYLETARVERYVNRGYAMLCDEFPWPFLETELTAQTAPVSISDLDQILYVSDATTNTPIYGDDQRTVAIVDPDRSATGSAVTWYLTDTTLNLYPADTSASLTIRYIQVPDELEDDTDEPLVPQRYRNLITDAAVFLALKDNDEFDAAMSAKQLWDVEVQKMYARLAGRNMQNPGSVVASSTYPYPY